MTGLLAVPLTSAGNVDRAAGNGLPHQPESIGGARMLNNLGREEIEQHVKILATVMIVGEIIPVVCSAVSILSLLAIGAVSDDPEATMVLGTIGGIAFCATTVLALPGLVAGLGLLRRQAWARYLALAVAVINLLLIPVGTLVGLYAFWVLLQGSATAYFADSSSALDV